MKTQKVRLCFGHYGEKEEKNCRDDCGDCYELKDKTEIIFCPKKRAYPCEVLCGEVNLCKQCYWMWWDKNINRRCSLKEEIRIFMKDNRLIFNKNKN